MSKIILTISLTLFGALFAGTSFAEPASDSLFSLLDANKDGKVTSDEVNEKQKSHFNRLLNVSDKNKDGVLTQDEFTEGLKEPEATPMDNSKESRKSKSDKKKKKQMFSYISSLFKKFDKNKDDKVTREEIPQQLRPRVAQLFQRLGKNEITKDDLEKIREKMGIEPEPTAEGESKKQAAKIVDTLFASADKNEDGFITIDEIPEDKKSNFELSDANKDGKVTKKELQVALAKVDMQTGGPFKRKFDELDKDGNGSLSKKEAPAKLGKMFSRIDSDDDGKVTIQELSSYLQKQKQRKNKKKES